MCLPFALSSMSTEEKVPSLTRNKEGIVSEMMEKEAQIQAWMLLVCWGLNFLYQGRLSTAGAKNPILNNSKFAHRKNQLATVVSPRSRNP